GAPGYFAPPIGEETEEIRGALLVLPPKPELPPLPELLPPLKPPGPSGPPSTVAASAFVNTHAAPVSMLSAQPAISAMFASPESATLPPASATPICSAPARL